MCLEAHKGIEEPNLVGCIIIRCISISDIEKKCTLFLGDDVQLGLVRTISPVAKDGFSDPERLNVTLPVKSFV
jgi:hypothetical protein